MEYSRLGSLPAEIRHMITAYALTTKNGTIPIYSELKMYHGRILPAHMDRKVEYVHCQRPCIHDVLGSWPATCKQSREECGSLVLALNEFDLSSSIYYSKDMLIKSAKLTRDVLHRLGSAANTIRHLTIMGGLENGRRLRPNDILPSWKELQSIKTLLHPDAVLRVQMLFEFSTLRIRGVKWPVDMDLVLPVGDSKGISAEIDKDITRQISLYVKDVIPGIPSSFEDNPAMCQAIHAGYWACANAVKRVTEALGE